MDRKIHSEKEKLRIAQERVKDIKGFYIHLMVYILVNLFIIIGSSGDGEIFSAFLDIHNYITAFFWGIGLVAHWTSVFGTGLFLGRRWEERKIKELLEKEVQEKRKWE